MPHAERIDLDAWVDRDLTASAKDLLPAFEVDALVAQAEEVLRAAGNRTPVFVGPNGVGKTALVHELVRRAHAGAGVPLLRRARVLQFSLRAIAARFKEKADATNFFSDLVSALLASPEPIVPFFKDVHLAYVLDFEPALHRLLSSLPHPALAEALPRELEQLVEYWSELSNHLVAIPVEEPAPGTLRSIVRRWCDHQRTLATERSAPPRTVRPEAQRAAIELTARFMGDRPFPRKVLELLRQTADFAPGAAGDDDEVPVTVRDVVRRFSQLTRVPERLVDPDQELDLAAVHEFVADRLLGQDEAVDAVVRMIALMKAGLADLRRPFGTFLFVGPTGVGKTFCAQLLAEYLFGDRNRLLRLNLADYGEPYHVQVLFGDPHGHSVPDQRGLLTRRLAGTPFGVLLLDEFEKAHPKVHDAFLQLVDEGRFINGRSEVVSVASLIVIATSNAGAEVYRESGLGFDRRAGLADLDRELDRRLYRQFRFELLNRFDRVVHFHPLDRADIRSIAKRELQELALRDGLQSRELQLEVDAEVLDWLVAHGWHPHFGARFLRREIERSVAGTLAEHVVRESPPRGSRIALGVRHGRVEARLVAAPPPPKVVVPSTHGGEVVLDRERLLEEARSWVERFEPLREESRLREAEASALIASSTSEGFWDDAERAQEVLRRYKDLDARVQTDRRLVRSVDRLKAVLAREEDPALEDLAALVQQAATAYRRWLDIGADSGPSGVWLVLGPADASADNADWLTALAALYRGWFRRRGLQEELVAEEVVRGRLLRLVFEVEGPAVGRLLEMERGEHRRRSQEGGVDRATVEVIPRGERPGPDDLGGVVDAKRTKGTAVERRAARARLELPARGLRMELHGTSRETLAWLIRDLAAALAAPSDAGLGIARTYGLRGGTAHDPRTNTSVALLKDVLRGHLDPFQRAWEVR